MLSVLIVGAGAIADAHVHGFLELGPRIRIAGVVNRDQSRAIGLIERHRLSAKPFGDYRQALAEVKPDIAVVLTPAASHAEIAVDCLRAGAHVLLEKPMAPSLAECDAILEAEKRAGKIVSVVAQSRFLTTSWNVKRLLDDGMCGKLLYSEAYSAWWRDVSYHYLAYRGRWSTECGGVTLGHAVHHIDLLLWMSGMPIEITSVIGNLAHTNSELEDISMAVLRFADGSLGQITASLVHHGEPQRMLFETEKAGITIPFSVKCSKGLPNAFPEPDEEFERLVRERYESYPPLEKQGHAAQIENFVAAVETGAAPLVTGQSGRNAMEVIVGIYKSSVERRPVALPIERGDPFYSKDGMIAAMPRFHEKVVSVDKLSGPSISLAGDRMK